MIDHKEQAAAYFMAGCNCAQSVFCAFEDVTGLDHETSLRLGSSYGGGIGRLREVCGAFSAAAGVLGLLYGYTELEDPARKAAHYALIQSFAENFKASHGTIICRELLAGVETDTSPNPSPRTPAYHAARPCKKFVMTAAALVDDVIRSRESD